MPNIKTWVDFRQVRESVDFAIVLEAYGVTLKLQGDQHHGFCPLPDHDGKKRSPSFSAHLGKKAFQCFGCGAKGNAIDFVALMESLNPADPQDIRQAALLIQERFLQEEAEPVRRAPVQTTDQPKPKTPTTTAERRPARPHRRHQSEHRQRPVPAKSGSTSVASEASPEASEPDNRPRIINAPLDFELKNLDPNHPYLKERGLTTETIETFGLGFSNRGIMAGRIAIPLQNAEGQLIGYAGRLVDDSSIGEENPKYRLPGSREREGTVFEFRKGEFLFGGHRIEAPVSDLIIVEGFFSVFHLHQCGWENVVALMGSSCSPEQAALIIRLTDCESRIWIMSDGDPAGVRCAESVFKEVASERFVRRVALESGEQPEDCDTERLFQLLSMPVK